MEPLVIYLIISFFITITILGIIYLILWMFGIKPIQPPLSLEQLDEKTFILSPFKYQMVEFFWTNPDTGDQNREKDESKRYGIKITTTNNLWVDDARIPSMIRAKGFETVTVDPMHISVRVLKDERMSFIETIAPDLRKLSKIL